ncbi:MAG TPA: hypothetical protein VMM93_12345 [Vicinamibacterales bacterium]|nr:hypothetical protein [Vicinamibacterales bacterium]
MLVPVAWSGGLPALWDYGFAGKGGYLTLGGVSFAESLRGWLAALAAPISGPSLGTALHGVVLILPLAVLALAAVRARSLDTRTWIIVLFAVLATLTALPRWDRFHMAHAVPLHAVALAALASRARAISTTPARRRTGRAATVTSLAIIAIGLVVALHPAGALLGEGREPSRLTHFRGPLIAPATAADLEEAAGRIAREAAGQPVFILSLEAGFWHLASGVPNATPFDIPATTSLGATGVTWLADRLADGRIRQVCVDRRRQDRLVLVDLAALVDATFDRGADVGPCTWYRFREQR